MLLGGVLAGELGLERAHEDVVHERALAAARDTGDGSDGTQRDAKIDALEVVLARAAEHEPLRADAPPCFGDGDRALAGEVFPGERALRHARHRSDEHELAALLA